jgi:hypothetical protein
VLLDGRVRFRLVGRERTGSGSCGVARRIGHGERKCFSEPDRWREQSARFAERECRRDEYRFARGLADADRIPNRGSDADKRGRHCVRIADADAVSLADSERLHALGRDDVHGVR